MTKSDKDLLRFVFEQIETLEVFLEGADEDSFLRDEILKDACMMKLIVIGEYSWQISDEAKNRFKEIEWQLIKSARNYYVHAYGYVNWARVWETLNEYVPDLKKKIQRILEEI